MKIITYHYISHFFLICIKFSIFFYPLRCSELFYTRFLIHLPNTAAYLLVSPNLVALWRCLMCPKQIYPLPVRRTLTFLNRLGHWHLVGEGRDLVVWAQKVEVSEILGAFVSEFLWSWLNGWAGNGVQGHGGIGFLRMPKMSCIWVRNPPPPIFHVLHALSSSSSPSPCNLSSFTSIITSQIGSTPRPTLKFSLQKMRGAHFVLPPPPPKFLNFYCLGSFRAHFLKVVVWIWRCEMGANRAHTSTHNHHHSLPLSSPCFRVYVKQQSFIVVVADKWRFNA